MKRTILINAVIWAVVILSSSWLFKDSANYGYLLAILVMGAGFTNSLLYSQFQKGKSRNCLK